MSAISGASGPKSATAGSAGALARSVRSAVTPPAINAAAAIANARYRLREERRAGGEIGFDRRARVTDTRVRTRGRDAPSPPRREKSYQSNFAPNRKRRGGTIVVGVVKLAPELQMFYAAGFVFVNL